MIALTVLSYNGEPAEATTASFDELGGTIGRSENNQLVLPDPERTISRVHARVVFRSGSYAIVDNGRNPISVNGVPVGSGREQPLAAGDQVQIGAYVLKVSQAPSSRSSDDPFADLFGDAAVGLASPAPPPAHRPPAVPPRAAARPPIAPAAAPPASQIPDDWDPFAPDPVSVPAPLPRSENALSDFSMGGRSDSIDDLFGLGQAPLGADPLGAKPAAATNMAAHFDPLQAFSRPLAAAPATLADHGSELNTPMPLPAQAATTPPSGAVFSWNAALSSGGRVNPPGARDPGAGAPKTMPTAAAFTAPVPAPVAPRELDMVLPTVSPAPAAPALAVEPAAKSARPASPSSAAAGAAPAGSAEELRAAFLAGLGAPGLALPTLSPETMRLVGELMREAMRGTVELLVARAALKREMRAEMTMIVARENNPLKFSPSVEVALQHLLGPSVPGFMPAAEAVRDAFDDLRAHQLGVMAGMRAALDGVLQRFDPQQLETKLTRGSALASLIPATRKARLWELFQQLFGQLQAEAQDDFDELFGKAFLKAYEDQLDRLHGEAGRA